jgi:hypothetical protein
LNPDNPPDGFMTIYPVLTFDENPAVALYAVRFTVNAPEYA